MNLIKTCKICKSKYAARNSLQRVCSVECALIDTQKKREKKAAQANAAEIKKTRERLDKLKSTSQVASEVQRVFNEYIRLRDYGLPCIACGKEWGYTQHASHYIPSGRNSALRFNEDNVHGGCDRCNTHLSGNLIQYRIGLVEKIGEDKVRELEYNHDVKKWTREELDVIKEIYKKKIKKLKKELQ